MKHVSDEAMIFILGNELARVTVIGVAALYQYACC
jgi:hypothetical protein